VNRKAAIPAKAEHPVTPAAGLPQSEFGVTGSPAFTGDDIQLKRLFLGLSQSDVALVAQA
jgi:hypothetical protein